LIGLHASTFHSIFLDQRSLFVMPTFQFPAPLDEYYSQPVRRLLPPDPLEARSAMWVLASRNSSECAQADSFSSAESASRRPTLASDNSVAFVFSFAGGFSLGSVWGAPIGFFSSTLEVLRPM